MGKLIQNINDVAEKCFGTTVDRLTRDVYRYTHCGAFIAWSKSQVTIGSIIEGSDAEFWRSFEYPFDSDEIDRWIADLEKLCDEAWKKVNMNELLKNFTNCDNLTLMSYELRDHDGNVIKEGLAMKKEMKLMELAELVYKMKDDEVIDFAPGDEEEVEYWGGWCGVKKINEFDNDNPMYIVSHYGGEAEAYLYHISEYDHRIGDFVAEEMPVWWKVTDRNRINCCAKMIADYCENWGEGFVPEVFTVDCYDCDRDRYI